MAYGRGGGTLKKGPENEPLAGEGMGRLMGRKDKGGIRKAAILRVKSGLVTKRLVTRGNRFGVKASGTDAMEGKYKKKGGPRLKGCFKRESVV